MTDSRTKALALVAAAEAFSTGTGLVLVRELRTLLEGDSAAATTPVHGDAAEVSTTDPKCRPPVQGVAHAGELVELQAEVARLRAELARAKDAARKRSSRRQAPVVVDEPDPRQGELFAPPPASSDRTFRTDVRTFSPKDPDPVFTKPGSQDPTGRASVRHEPDHPPPWVFDDATATRPDLSEYVLREMWRRFARRRAVHKSDADARRHFATWLKRQEDRSSAAEAPPDAPPSSTARVVVPLRERPPEDDVEPPRGDFEPDGCILPFELRREIAQAKLRELAEALDAQDGPIPRSMSA